MRDAQRMAAGAKGDGAVGCDHVHEAGQEALAGAAGVTMAVAEATGPAPDLSGDEGPEVQGEGKGEAEGEAATAKGNSGDDITCRRWLRACC